MIITFIRRLFAKSEPTHCRCVDKAIVIDDRRPWIGYCGRCYLRKAGKL